MSAATSNVAMNLPHRQTRDGNGEPQDLWDIAQPPCCHQIGCTPSEEGSSGMTEYKWEFLLLQYPYSNKELHKEKKKQKRKSAAICFPISLESDENRHILHTTAQKLQKVFLGYFYFTNSSLSDLLTFLPHMTAILKTTTRPGRTGSSTWHGLHFRKKFYNPPNTWRLYSAASILFELYNKNQLQFRKTAFISECTWFCFI